jgi:hypothetical protein
MLLLLLSACSSSKIAKQKAQSISSIKYVGQYELPHNMNFNGTVVGGLSGIDYDKANDLYYMICDDPSVFSPARYYTVRIACSNKGIDSVTFVNVTSLLAPNGLPYPDITKDRIHSADLECLRLNKTNNTMYYATEGQRHLMADGNLEIQQPTIVIMDKEGRYKDSFELPANMHFTTIEKGPRHNSVFEGLDFTEHNKHILVSVEEPLYEDGARAGLKDTTAWIRLIKFDTKTKKQVAQYAYQIDPVPFPPTPANAFRINGVSDIMYLGNDKLLVIERAYSKGRKPSDIKLYLADMKDAENIANNTGLVQHPVTKPITKKLLLDFNALGLFVDNIEGVTFGPKLPNGKQSLVLVADNNFDKTQITQFWLFEVE